MNRERFDIEQQKEIDRLKEENHDLKLGIEVALSQNHDLWVFIEWLSNNHTMGYQLSDKINLFRYKWRAK
jgi:hypothetical protein